MNLDPLIRHLKGFVSFTQTEFDQFSEYLSIRILEKGEQWEPLDKISQIMGFVNTGVLRQYILKDGEEYTNEFYAENDFVGNHMSYQTQSPSTMITEALERCELVVIPFKVFASLADRLPATQIAADIVGTHKLINLQKRTASLLTMTPEERYYQLMQERPEIINRVSQYLIAQYLGIKPESLSRIRKRNHSHS